MIDINENQSLLATLTLSGPQLAVDLVICGRADDVDIHQFDKTASANLSDLFERSRHEAVAGAEFVFWSECADYVGKQIDSGATGRGSEFAMGTMST